MRWIRTPKKRSLVGINPKGEVVQTTMSFKQWCGQYLFPQKKLRNTPDVALRIIEKVNASSDEDGIIELSDAEHEILLSLAKEAEYPDAVAGEFMHFQAAIHCASHELPPKQLPAESQIS